MNTYMQRVGFTAWRKRTTILVASGLLTLILFGLQFSKVEETNALMEERDAQGIQDALLRSINVKFIESSKLVSSNKYTDKIPSKTATDFTLEELSRLGQPSRDDIAKRQIQKQSEQQQIETEQQMGVPYFNYDPKSPYVPKKRIVHFDLKGAPPTIAYFKKLIPLIKSMGATGILLEYEDMFPFSGILKPTSAKNAYTEDQIKDILKLAEDSKLDVIPLVQTFGHVEFALKHSEFKHLREVPGSPQSLCPSRNGSFDFIREVINQVMALHPTTQYLHIGCDEVFEMGECELCRLQIRDTLFLKHIQNVVGIVKEKYPKVRILIWDDMLRHISQQSMVDMKIGELVEPMVWVYAEDIYRFVQPQVWEKYAAVFKTAWTASAFKGAFGETLYVPNSKRHLENNLHWLDVMSTQNPTFKHGFAGIVLTGWQRYDHFAVLCELLPASTPSLALNLIAVSHGFFNSTLKDLFLTSLSCPVSQNPGRSSPFISLDVDPFMWDKLSRCMFPGNEQFRLTYRLHNAESEAKEYLDTTTKQRGWMTAYNARHNYSLPLRVEELSADLPRVYHGMVGLARSTVTALKDIFDDYTILEWIEQRIYPYITELEKLQNQSLALKSVDRWEARPLPPLKELQRLGIAVNVN